MFLTPFISYAISLHYFFFVCLLDYDDHYDIRLKIKLGYCTQIVDEKHGIGNAFIATSSTVHRKPSSKAHSNVAYFPEVVQCELLSS
jgi:hypothetical protein